MGQLRDFEEPRRVVEKVVRRVRWSCRGREGAIGVAIGDGGMVVEGKEERRNELCFGGFVDFLPGILGYIVLYCFLF